MSQRIRASFEDPLGPNAWVSEISCDRSVGAWQSSIPEALRCVLTLPNPEGRTTANAVNLLVEQVARCGLRIVQIQSFDSRVPTPIQTAVAKASLTKLGFAIHQTDGFVCGYKQVDSDHIDGLWSKERNGSIWCDRAYFITPPNADIASLIKSPEFASCIERGDVGGWALSRSATEALAKAGFGFFYGKIDQADLVDAVVVTLSRQRKPLFDAISSSSRVERCAVSKSLHPFVE